MADRLLALERVVTPGKRSELQLGLFGQGADDPAGRVVRLPVGRLHLDPVAGRQHDRLGHAVAAQTLEKPRHGGVLDKQLVAQHDWAGAMIRADHNEFG